MTGPIAQFVAIITLLVAATLAWTLKPLLARQAASGLPDRKSAHRATALVLTLAIPSLATLLYASLGDPALLRMPAPDAVATSVDRMIARLAAHLDDQPADARGWRLLARSYDERGRHADATRAWTRLVELEPGNADALADLANALSMEQSGRYAGEPIRRAREALAIDPDNAKALAIAANEASERKDFDAAIAAWERLRAVVPPGSEVMKAIDDDIEAARAAAGR